MCHEEHCKHDKCGGSNSFSLILVLFILLVLIFPAFAF
jgi:conserved hypothetical tiny transmembrane protein